MGEIIQNSIDRADMDIEVFTVWYNRDQHVDRSIDILFQQTSSNLSIFVVDDDSDDNTLDKLVEKWTILLTQVS